MGQLIINKPKIKFIKRFIQVDIVVLSIAILGGIISLVVPSKPTKDNIEWSVIIIIVLLSLALISRLLRVYFKEKKTIIKMEVNVNNDLMIELTRFDNQEQLIAKLDHVDVNLKRIYRRDEGLRIDFWIDENGSKRKVLRQYCNKVWDSRDIKSIFLAIKELKSSELTKREKDIVDDVEFS